MAMHYSISKRTVNSNSLTINIKTTTTQSQHLCRIADFVDKVKFNRSKRAQNNLKYSNRFNLSVPDCT